MATKRDYYEILGLQKGASEDAIKKAYRRMAMKCHPDKNPGDKAAEEKFKEANEANEVLSDPKKRQLYDQFGHAGVDPQAGMGGAGHGFGGGFQGGFGGFQSGQFSDIFEDLFGGSGRRRGQAHPEQHARGADLRYDLQIALEEAFHGVSTLR